MHAFCLFAWKLLEHGNLINRGLGISAGGLPYRVETNKCELQHGKVGANELIRQNKGRKKQTEGGGQNKGQGVSQKVIYSGP